MATPQEKEDEQWLSALAGHPDPNADRLLNRQAESLRKALLAQKAALNAQTAPADETLYQQILFRLKREGLRGEPAKWQQPQFWAVAATVVLGVAIVLRAGLFTPSGEEDLFAVRGGGLAIVQIVDDPEARLTELLAGLRAIGAKPTVSHDNRGRVRLAVAKSEAVTEYLLQQRIEAQPVGDEVVIVLEKPATPKK